MVFTTGIINTKQSMFKIAIVGPESTGKSTLAKQLADHFNTVWVPEYSREFLEKTNGKYTEQDLIQILNGQMESENELVKRANKFIFCDTSPLVIWIWSKVKYGRVNREIEKTLQAFKHDYYLLTYPDLPWENDELRESEGQLTKLYNLYLKKLELLHYPYEIVSGIGNKRLQLAVNALKRFS